jgi:hypothetical protein
MRPSPGRFAAHARSLSNPLLSDLHRLFEPWVSLQEVFGHCWRDRVYTPARIFWGFLSQVFSPDGSCREAVRKLQGWQVLQGQPTASSNTAGYCTARKRLPLDSLEALQQQVAETIGKTFHNQRLWHARPVRVVDGSSVSMPDTGKNQAAYPQPKAQKPGCGFPVMRIVAVFCLGTGAILHCARAALSVAERTLFWRLWDHFTAGDVVLADRGFCGYADFFLLKQRGIDCVMRNHQRRKVGLSFLKRLGKHDRLIQWHKTGITPKGLTREAWQAMPERMTVRELLVHVDVPGFRTRKVTVVTTLLDPVEYPARELADLYRRRWYAELFLRDIKITMAMDVLRCKTPDMVHKELTMHLIAYNLVRALMLQAAQNHEIAPDRISFKGTVATVRQWAPIITAADPAATTHLTERLLAVLANDPLPNRPDRLEPRAKKRRPKNYQCLTKPRRLFKECAHRGKYKKGA